jgi:hypothetical protein
MFGSHCRDHGGARGAAATSVNRVMRMAGIIPALVAYGYFNPLRVEHIVIISLFIGLVTMRPTRRLALTWTPILAFALVYDFLRVFDVLARGRVSIGVVDAMELRLFGISTPYGVVGPVEWLSTRTAPWLDWVGAVFYSSHLVFGIVVAMVFYWRSSMDPTQAVRTYGFLWGFMMLNVLAFCIQVLWPVAPPWFVGTHMGAHEVIGNAAGLLRVDAMMGNHHFAGVYAKSAYVFGAMPSLHVAVPVWVAIWVKGPVRVLAILHALGMSFFAVYFGHHFVLDILAGALLAGFVTLIVQKYSGEIEALQTRIISWGFDE